MPSSHHLEPKIVKCLLITLAWGVLGFPGGSEGKETTCSAGDLGSIPVLGRSPGGGHSNPLQYSWRILVDKGAWWSTVHGVTKS